MGANLIYIYVLIFLVLLNAVKIHINGGTIKKIIDIIVLLFMVGIYGFRYYVGMDYGSYEYNYYSSTMSSKGIIYSFMENLFYNVGFEYFYFTIFIGLIFFMGIYKISKLYKIDFITVVIFFVITGQLFVSFNIVRQSIASIFVCIGLYYAYNKKIVNYLFFFFIAAGFHISSLIFIPFYFISNINIKFKKAIILASLGVTLYLVNLLNSSFVKAIIPSVYQWYIGSRFDVNTNPGLGAVFYVIVALIIAYIIKNEDKKIKPLVNFYIILNTILLFTLKSSIFVRIPRYSFFAIPIILVYFLAKYKTRLRNVNIQQALICLVIIGYIMIFGKSINNIIFADDYRVLQYKSIFSIAEGSTR